MTSKLETSIDILKRTPEILRAWLMGAGDFWARSNYGPDTFSPFDVVGHLIHGERTNWMVRVRAILEHGEAVPFPSFDRYAMYAASEGKGVAELLNTFTELRAKNIGDLTALGLTDEMMQLCGSHPQLGTVTLENLIAAWVVHDLGHLHQITKAMAFQYRDAVGPWQPLLTILPKS
jgi:DinB superfamily